VNSTCIIAKDDFSVFCFGDRYGSTRKHNWVPEKIDLAGSIGTLSNVKQIGLGRGFGCALSRSSQVFCWGRNDLNQLGALVSLPGMTKATSVKVTYPQEGPILKVDQLAVGDSHACALHRDEKTVYCWGDNRFGQLGNTSVRGLPEQVALGSNNLTLKGVREVAVGPDRTCIISSRDEVFCWGNGAHGILGSEKVLSPYPVRALDANAEALSGANQIVLGVDHSCIIDTGQKMYCFGINEFGQLGSRFISGVVMSALFKPIDKVSAIDTFAMRTCMVYGADQSVACFGGRDIDNLNQKYESNSFVPEEIRKGMAPYKGVLGVAVGTNHLCVITPDQTVECLGDGSKGQLGAGETQSVKYGVVQDERQLPVKDVWQIKTKVDWNCALKQESGAIWCWGQWKNKHWLNAKHIQVTGKPSSDFIQLALSEDQVCGVHGVERGVYCSTADDKSADHLDLVPLLDFDGRPLRKILGLSGGRNHLCALDDEGHAYCWGSNSHGQLGLKTVRETMRAMKVTFKKESLRKVSRISAGERHTCVTSSEDAAFYCFGEDFFGGPNSADPVEYPL
jgi:alpha-tubulin suppressor-like RCC1 family protein